MAAPYALQRSEPAAVPVLRAEDISIRYETERRKVLAVDRVSFDVAAGERLVLLGPSGCGKSSILKACAGFLPLAGGEISLRGRKVTGPGPDRMVVFQEFDQLLPWKTVRDNVAFPMRIARKLSRAEALRRAEEALVRVGLGRAVDAYPHTLSGGMKQRAAIARALASEPDVLLMDEPFAALDALTRRKLQEDLLRLAEEIGFTLLFITHSIEEAILVGTRLHLLSANPGRTLATRDTAAFGAPDSPGLATLAREIHELLFGHAADTIHD